MNTLLPVTELLYSCWIIACPKTPLPNGRGILDHALKHMADAGDLPDWARDRLTFAQGRAGLVCIELPAIQALATETKLTVDPNPSYTQTDIAVSDLVASRCLDQLGIERSDAERIGGRLKIAIEQAEEKLYPCVR